MVLEMVTGKRPWSHLDNEWAIMYHIGVASRHPPLPEVARPATPGADGAVGHTVVTMSEVGVEFLKQCFLPATERPNVTKLLQHSFFDKTRRKLDEFRARFPTHPAPYPNPWTALGGFVNALYSPGFSPGLSSSLRHGHGSYFPHMSSATSTQTNSVMMANLNQAQQFSMMRQ